MFAFTHRDIDNRFLALANSQGWGVAVSTLKQAAQEMLDLHPGVSLKLSSENYFKVPDVGAINMLDAAALLSRWRKIVP